MPSRPVQVSRQFNASPESVYDTWLKPEWVKRWLFKSDSNEITTVEINPRPGGHFSILELNNGEEIDHFGNYREPERPHRLVFTLEVPKHFPGQTLVTVIIKPVAGGSVLNFTQTGVSPEITESNWKIMPDRLNEALGNKG